MRRIRLTAGACALATAMCAVPAGAAQAAPATSDARLAKIVNRYSKAQGVRRNHTPEIESANLPPALANALTSELRQLYRCDRLTRTYAPGILGRLRAGFPNGAPPVFPSSPQRGGDTVLGVPTPAAPNPALPKNFPFEGRVRRCGEASVRKLEALRADLGDRNVPASKALDLWPILRFAPGKGHHTYKHDYVLLVELGGHNRYFNNAGGGGIDIWRGPTGSGAKIAAPARGCVDAFDVIRRRTCTFGSAALLSMKGHNQYGRLEAPVANSDGVCTNDAVQRRTFVQASGVIGVGAIIDAGGNNTYVGKTLTTGVGHIGGYGHLRAYGDNNSYRVVRSGMGAAIVGGIGTLDARGDHNSYGYYMPRPINAAAERGTHGSGGIVNDLNGCDNGTATTLGAGIVGGVGVFTATGVDNRYLAPPNSLGWGTELGKGTFSSTGGGADAYAGAGAIQGGRHDNLTVAPTSTNNGTFVDR